MKIFFSPHNDDIALFGSYTAQRESPWCYTLCDSYAQAERDPQNAATAMQRRAEDEAAYRILCPAGPGLTFVGLDDRALDPNDLELLFANMLPAFGLTRLDQVWLPEPEEGGNAHHNLIGRIGYRIFTAAGVQVTRYTTYTTRGRSSWGDRVPFTGEMVRRKLRAMACFKSQIDRSDQVEHFTRGLDEFYVPEGAPLWNS